MTQSDQIGCEIAVPISKGTVASVLLVYKQSTLNRFHYDYFI